ncbi:Hypothetical_protein [Hexamita inflata]|uniref:Hypothetical_protein n=1 Tax=Hexamita inflata TaxID=28002 RepID=A0ABP1H6L7_9EUKA
MAMNAVHRKIQSRGRPIQFLTVRSVIFQSADEYQQVLGQEIRQQSLSLVKSVCLQLVSEISQMLFIFGVVCAPDRDSSGIFIRLKKQQQKQTDTYSLTLIYFRFRNILTPHQSHYIRDLESYNKYRSDIIIFWVIVGVSIVVILACLVYCLRMNKPTKQNKIVIQLPEESQSLLAQQ